MADREREDEGGRGIVLEARPWAGFRRVFGRYVARLIRKRFNAVRVVRGTESVLRESADWPGAMLVVLNHQSWWDPLIGLYLADSQVPGRFGLAPMDIAQLRKMGIFRWLGIFGVDPDDPASLRAMGAYVKREFAERARPTLWITPQGRFVDPRRAVELRPGAAALAARLSGDGEVAVVCIAVEYPFWTEQRPEVCLRLMRCPGGHTSTAGWQRAMTEAMNENARELATRVMARDERAFVTLSGGVGARTNSVYDAWLKLQGKSARVEDRRWSEGRGA